MANNRLYIVDTETGERFLLCKSSGYDWNVFTAWIYYKNKFFSFVFQRWIYKLPVIRRLVMANRVIQLGDWLNDRDVKAAEVGGVNSTLKLLTEYEV